MKRALRPFLAAYILALLALAAFLPAQGVDKPEIQSVAGRTLEFINYVGPQTIIETKAQIRGIGEAIGSSIASGSPAAGDAAKYQAIHVVDPAVKTGFDADIIVLGKNAKVDHIRNLRWIIAGYLEKAYAYSAVDADLLATFITIYNAVYRGNIDGLSARYKPKVMSYLEKAKVGLSLHWDEWAGKSQIVIPLSAGATRGNISSVETGSLTEGRVVDELRKTEDRGVQERQDLVELKERELAEARRKAEAERLAAEEAARIQAQKDEEAAAARKAAEDAAAAERAAIEQHGTDSEAARKAAEERAAAEAEAARLKAEADKAAADKAAADAAAANASAAADAKQGDIAGDRASIAADQQALINAGIGATTPEKGTAPATFVEAISRTSPLGRLVSIDTNSGRTLKNGEFNTIRIPTIVQDGNTWYCVAGSADKAVRLASLDGDSLALKATGADPIYEGSFLVLKDGSLYAILERSGQYYLGRFGTDLKLGASSAQTVHRFTALIFRDDGVVVQMDGGGFAVLDKSTLKVVKTFK